MGELRDIYCWNSGSSCFDDVGSEDYPDEDCYNVYDNIQAWDNGASYGIHISRQHSGIVSNSFASGNGRAGIFLYDVEDFNIHNCSMTLNREGIYVYNSDNVNIDNCSASLNTKEGIYIRGMNNVNITNVIARSNPLAGIAVEGCNDIRLTSCQCYDDMVPPVQAYGVTIEGTCTGISLLYCTLSPNKYGDIYNPNNSEYTIT